MQRSGGHHKAVGLIKGKTPATGLGSPIRPGDVLGKGPLSCPNQLPIRIREGADDKIQIHGLILALNVLEKSKGNLVKEETDLLENLLYELRMAYLAKKGGPK